MGLLSYGIVLLDCELLLLNFSSLFGSNPNKDCVLKGCGIQNILFLLKFNRD